MIKLQKLISGKVEEFLNASIKKEMESATIYYGMASWLNSKGYDNGYKLFIKYGDEENKHAHLLMDYLDNRNCTAVIPAINKPIQEFSTCMELIEKAYQHEVDIEDNYKQLSVVSMRESDFTTFHLAHDFLGEQIEEIEKMLEFINIININENNPNLPAIIEEAFEDALG